MRDTTSLSLGRETLLSLASKVVMAGIGFGGTIIFARVLGPSGFGLYKTVIAAAMVFSQVSAGTGTAVRKRVSEVDADPREFLGAGLVVHGVFSLVLAGSYLLFQPLVNSYFETEQIAIAALVVVFAFGLFTITNRTYSGLGYPSGSSWVDTLRSLFTFGFQVLFVYLDYGALGLVGGFILGTLLSSAVSLLAARIVPALPGRESFERLLSFARWSISNALLRKGYSQSDLLLINALVGSGAAGYYATAIQLSIPGAMFGGSIRDALVVKSSGRSSADLGIREDLVNSTSYAGLFSMPILFGALAIPEQLMVTIFGPAFAPASLALIGLTLYQLLYVYRGPFEAAAEGTDNPDLIFKTNLVVFVLYVPIAVFLGMEYGLIGVVSGSIFSEIARLAVYQYVAARRFGGAVFPRPVLQQMAASLVMYLAVSSLVPEVVTVSSWVWLAVVVGIGAVVYFGSLLAISGHFRDTTLGAIEDTVGVDL